MNGSMGGYYETRVAGPCRQHYRLFCLLNDGNPDDLAALGFDRPQIETINGMVKPNAALFNDSEYRKHVRDLGNDYIASHPRRIASS